MNNNDIMKTLNINKEEEILKEIQTLNQKNREERAVLNSTIAQTTNQIQALLNANPEYANMIDVNKLSDLEYVNTIFNNFLLMFEREKQDFNKKATEALNLLKNI